RRLLIGSYFTQEYALESAALFNPSMVWHPDQSGLPAGSRRFILSLRATGEGHISSITFRSGRVDAENRIRMDEPTRFVAAPELDVSERIIFPSSPTETNGIEDARFVRFAHDDGRVCYYATYTAYDGRMTLPQMLETEDFLHFKVSTLNGSEVRNKGFALFPR